jgi:two-component system torCAD operon response regulator TorR
MKPSSLAHIIVVDDEPITRELISGYLSKENYSISEAGNGIELEILLTKTPADLILLDINLPGKDGFTLARELRSRSDIGIIMITQRDNDIDRIIGLEIGADDYITKPFNPRELIARVRSVLRRVQLADTNDDSSPLIHFQDWSLHIAGRYLISPEGKEIHLSSGEYELLTVFIQKPNTVLSRERLANMIDPQSKAMSRSVDVLITRLRRKLCDDAHRAKMIVTVYGVGYIFANEA